MPFQIMQQFISLLCFLSTNVQSLHIYFFVISVDFGFAESIGGFGKRVICYMALCIVVKHQKN